MSVPRLPRILLLTLVTAGLAAVETIRINFQPADVPVPAGHLVDSGAVFGDRGAGRTYGWNAPSASPVDRDHVRSPDQRFDTFVPMRSNPDPLSDESLFPSFLPDTPNAWGITLPNGRYGVRLIVGDPAATSIGDAYALTLQGDSVLTGTASGGNRWFEVLVQAEVTEGLLSIAPASAGGVDRLCAVEITGPFVLLPEEVLRVNFQPATAPLPTGYIADSGAPFASHPSGFELGWNAANSAGARDRDSANSPDQRYDTSLPTQHPGNPDASWRVALPDGVYGVRGVAGDPNRGQDAVYAYDLEGMSFIAGEAERSFRFALGAALVSIEDGFLDLGNGAGALRNRICFLDIGSLGSSAATLVGPFLWTRKLLDPPDAVPSAVAIDGSVEDVRLASGDAVTGSIATVQWQGDNQAGGRSFAGNNLIAPVGSNWLIGLEDWTIENRVFANGDWVDYTRFQQDAQLRLGFVAAPQVALPLSHGAGFALGSALPQGQIVLSLPFRWVQGGGSTWQTAAHGGVPVEAGLWQVPPGTSLAAAQQDPDNRLAGFDSLLQELPPNPFRTGFKLQVQPDGAWQVSIDIDQDGVIDRDLTSADPGHRPSDAVTTDEGSGLVISLLAAGGTHGGRVGRTPVTLAYRSDPSAPIGPARDRRPFSATIPNESLVSPAVVAGRRWSSSYTVSATSGGGPLPVDQVGERDFTVAVPLSSDPAGTPVQLSQSGTPPTGLGGTIGWRPLDLQNTDDAIIVQRGQSLLFTYNLSCGGGGGPDVVIDADGDGTAEFTGPCGSLVPFQYDTPGTFTAVAFLPGDAVPDGQVQVKVVDVELPVLIAAEVGFPRPVLIRKAVPSTGLLVPVAADPTELEVNLVEETAEHLHVQVRPLVAGSSPVLQVRSGSATGPVVASQEVQEFTFSSSAATGIIGFAEAGGGAAIGEANIVMEPWIPGLDIELEIFGGETSFPGFGRSRVLSTDDMDPATGEIRYEVAIPHLPEQPGLGSICHKVSFSQEDVYLAGTLFSAGLPPGVDPKISFTDANNGCSVTVVCPLCTCEICDEICVELDVVEHTTSKSTYKIELGTRESTAECELDTVCQTHNDTCNKETKTVELCCAKTHTPKPADIDRLTVRGIFTTAGDKQQVPACCDIGVVHITLVSEPKKSTAADQTGLTFPHPDSPQATDRRLNSLIRAGPGGAEQVIMGAFCGVLDIAKGGAPHQWQVRVDGDDPACCRATTIGLIQDVLSVTYKETYSKAANGSSDDGMRTLGLKEGLSFPVTDAVQGKNVPGSSHPYYHPISKNSPDDCGETVTVLFKDTPIDQPLLKQHGQALKSLVRTETFRLFLVCESANSGDHHVIRYYDWNISHEVVFEIAGGAVQTEEVDLGGGRKLKVPKVTSFKISAAEATDRGTAEEPEHKMPDDEPEEPVITDTVMNDAATLTESGFD